ncbi:MAG: RDD family protein [bacterium]|nr:RDD family protein [bacterium]
MEDVVYPAISRRYLSTLIDGLLILSAFMLSVYIFPGQNESSRMFRIILISSMFFIYEPVLTSRLCTLGQLITGIRVRKVEDLDKISVISAYKRIIVKIPLGLISFFSIPFTKGKRAIHDFAAGSIVIYSDSQ